ncbi:MAG: hypothetical protein JNL60_08385, partial [Bacteroidia bacterium]|nr:hypothetical protein [Bacteroidia bacterium]
MLLYPKLAFLRLCILLCFFSPTVYGQEESSDYIVVRSLTEKISKFYRQKNYLCYTFEKKEFLKNQSAWIISHGSVSAYLENDSVFFRVNHLYDSLKGNVYQKQFEAVSNRKLYGSNQIKYSYFKDYTPLFNVRKYYTLNAWPNTILTPDNYIEELCQNKKYRPLVRVKKDFYELELRDTMENGAGGTWWYFFYISKKDRRIIKQVSRSFQTLNDSTICTYTYSDDTQEKVMNYVNGFKAFNGGSSQSLDPYRDTIAFMPEFSLKDLKGKLPEITTPYVLINFWYQDCPPCLESLDQLEKIHYKKLTVLSVNVEDSLTS